MFCECRWRCKSRGNWSRSCVIARINSSFRNRPLPQDLVVFGEVGLAGEIRPVTSGQERISEAAKHGFKRAIVPFANKPKSAVENMEVFTVKKLADALAILDNF